MRESKTTAVGSSICPSHTAQEGVKLKFKLRPEPAPKGPSPACMGMGTRRKGRRRRRGEDYRVLRLLPTLPDMGREHQGQGIRHSSSILSLLSRAMASGVRSCGSPLLDTRQLPGTRAGGGLGLANLLHSSAVPPDPWQT